MQMGDGRCKEMLQSFPSPILSSRKISNPEARTLTPPCCAREHSRSPCISPTYSRCLQRNTCTRYTAWMTRPVAGRRGSREEAPRSACPIIRRIRRTRKKLQARRIRLSSRRQQPDRWWRKMTSTCSGASSWCRPHAKRLTSLLTTTHSRRREFGRRSRSSVTCLLSGSSHTPAICEARLQQRARGLCPGQDGIPSITAADSCASERADMWVVLLQPRRTLSCRWLKARFYFWFACLWESVALL